MYFIQRTQSSQLCADDLRTHNVWFTPYCAESVTQKQDVNSTESLLAYGTQYVLLNVGKLLPDHTESHPSHHSNSLNIQHCTTTFLLA
jgi:hypothetical protein